MTNIKQATTTPALTTHPTNSLRNSLICNSLLIDLSHQVLKLNVNATKCDLLWNIATSDNELLHVRSDILHVPECPSVGAACQDLDSVRRERVESECHLMLVLVGRGNCFDMKNTSDITAAEQETVTSKTAPWTPRVTTTF